tara:strand:+ start:115 stop:1521 length:1407 start_codon:yes stop_codon:yes gene_type:complete
MDEDKPKKKITLSNFFEQIVEVDKVAQTALSNSNNLQSQFNAIQLDLSRLIETLAAFEPIQTQLSQITNIIVQGQTERGLKLDQQEKELFAAEDKQQKKTEDKEKDDKKNIDDLKKDSLSDQVKNRLKESVTAIKDEISKSGALGVGLLSLGSYSAGSLMGDDKENKRGSGFNEDDEEDGYKDGGKVKKTGLSKVHQGEFVSTEKTVEMFGSNFLSRLNKIAEMNSYSLTGSAAELIGDDQEFLSEVNTVSAKHGINPAHLLGLIASESGFNPKAQNPDTDAAGLLQFKPEVAERYGTTVDKILKMSRVEQMRYVDMYLKETLPNNPSLGQLYTSTLMPTYASESPDFELMAKDARYGSGNAQMYSRNEGLDINKDGVITIKELGPRITSKMKEFGIIEKPIEKSSSDNSNIVLPPQIVQGSNQTVNDGGSRGDAKVGSDSVESTKSPIQSISISEFNSIENLNVLVS